MGIVVLRVFGIFGLSGSKIGIVGNGVIHRIVGVSRQRRELAGRRVVGVGGRFVADGGGRTGDGLLDDGRNAAETVVSRTTWLNRLRDRRRRRC